MQSYVARTVGTVWSHQVAACTASASQVSADHTVRMNRGARGTAKMEEPASKTHPTHTSTAATVSCTSPGDTVRTSYPYHALQPAPICSVSSTLAIRCVTISATTTTVSGTEATARSTGSSRGLTAAPVCPAGISLRMDAVIRSVTTLGASLTASSARRPHRPPASM